MATYELQVRSPWGRHEAFDFMADLTNVAAWDPGVTSATRVVGDGPGPGAAYDVIVSGIGRPLTLRYEIDEFDRPRRFVARASNRWLTSVDTISVDDDGTGAVVTYDAELTLNGPLGFADFVLQPGFTRVAERAASGLVTALDGERVEGADT